MLKKKAMKKKRWRWALLAAAAAGVLASLGGCAQIGYLGQSVGGHLRLVSAAKPVDEWLADPALKPALRERLQQSQRMRDFAVQQLHLPDNNSYRRYADLGRSAAVWNVVAAPELSLTLKTWCFPIMGCVGYRGYFNQAEAEAYAAELRAEGYEVMVYGVPAYSTLGWSRLLGGDPLLNTFMNQPEAELAGLIFHELSHQVVYAADDTQFNESFATAVERRGALAWLQAQGSAAERERYLARQSQRVQFRALTQRYRERLEALYAQPLDVEAKRAAKAQLLAEMRAEHAQLKAAQWGGDSGYDAWFARANNASFALLSAYTELAPQFEALLDREGGDWPRFYTAVKALAELPPEQRRMRLQELKNSAE